MDSCKCVSDSYDCKFSAGLIPVEFSGFHQLREVCCLFFIGLCEQDDLLGSSFSPMPAQLCSISLCHYLDHFARCFKTNYWSLRTCKDQCHWDSSSHDRDGSQCGAHEFVSGTFISCVLPDCSNSTDSTDGLDESLHLRFQDPSSCSHGTRPGVRWCRCGFIPRSSIKSQVCLEQHLDAWHDLRFQWCGCERIVHGLGFCLLSKAQNLKLAALAKPDASGGIDPCRLELLYG